MVCAVKNNGQSSTYATLVDRDEWVLVWLDANLVMLDAVSTEKVLMLLRIRIGNKSAWACYLLIGCHK